MAESKPALGKRASRTREMAPKRTRTALEPVEDLYGSIEEFAATVMDVCPGYVEGDYGASEAAQALELPLSAFMRAIREPAFNKVLDQLAAYSEYSFRERKVAMRNLASIARSRKKTVMTRSGEPAEVDRDADEMIKADSHLRKIQGQPLEGERRQGGGGITIIFGGQDGQSLQEVTIDVEANEPSDEGQADDAGEEVSDGYRGSKMGDLPPPGARRFYGDDSDGSEKQAALDPELDFHGEATEEPRGAGSVLAAKEMGKRDDGSER